MVPEFASFLEKVNAPKAEDQVGEVTCSIDGSKPFAVNPSEAWTEYSARLDGGALEGASNGILTIAGPLGIFQYRQITAAVNAMRGKVDRVGVVFGPSNGGDLAGLSGAVRSLVELRAEIGENLIHFVAGSTASATMALLLAGGRVLADPGVQVGSLAAAIEVHDNTKFVEEDLKTTVYFIRGDQTDKDVGHGGVPVTAKNLEQVGAQRESANEMFIELVAAARGVSSEAMAEIASTGGMFHATNALKLGLIDEITDEESFRALVTGNQPQETRTMADDPGAAPIIAENQKAAKPQAAAPDTPAVLPDFTTAAIQGLTAQVTQLTKAQAALTASVAARDALTAQDAAIAGFQSRVDTSCHAGTTKAQATMRMVERFVKGDEPGEAEKTVAELCAVPDLAGEANLMQEVTVLDPTGAKSTMSINAAVYGYHEQGGRAVPADAPASAEVAQIIARHTDAKGVENDAAIDHELALMYERVN